MPALSEEASVHAEPSVRQSPQRLRKAGVIHHRKQAPAELYGLDEAPGGQPARQRNIQPPNVGGGTGVRQYRHEQRVKQVQPARQEKGAGPVAAILPGAQY